MNQIHRQILNLKESGKLDLAAANCRELLAKNPSDAMALHILGLVLCDQGQTEHGVSLILRSVALEPKNADFHNNLGGILGAQRRFLEARAHVQEALRIEPALSMGHFNHGVISEALGDLTAAESSFRQTIALVPTNVDSKFRLGCVLHKQGKHDEGDILHYDLYAIEPPPPVDPAVSVALQNPRVVMVVTCKGRLGHLKQTVPAMLNFATRFNYRVVVVDYSDPENSFSWSLSQKHPRLVAIRVQDNAERFSKARAFNCGANALPSDILCFVDADSILDAKFLEEACLPLISPGNVLTRRQKTSLFSDTMGVCCVRTSVYRAIRGYDEQLIGYGPEDVDLFARARQHGNIVPFSPSLYPGAIAHSVQMRSQFYDVKSIRESTRRIVERITTKNRVVNPDGYGQCSGEWGGAENNFVAAPFASSEKKYSA